jgi:hypothetical protein
MYKRAEKGAEISLGMVLEQVRMRRSMLVEHLAPFKSISAFRAPRFDQPAQVVLAQRAEDLAINLRPIRRRDRRRRDVNSGVIGHVAMITAIRSRARPARAEISSSACFLSLAQIGVSRDDGNRTRYDFGVATLVHYSVYKID